MQRLRNPCSLLLALVILAPSISRGADVLMEVPSDALGFVLVHNLASVDAKVGRLATLLQRNLPRPLAFLKEITGVSEGLNSDGDFLLALFPAPDGSEQPLRFCVWLPVADYDRFLNSIGATSIEGIAAATIAGEDLLVARRGDWALVMDPDQRDRIAQLAAAPPSPPPINAWKQWINANDVTVVAFAPGVRELLAWVEESGDSNATTGAANSDEVPFGAPNQFGNRRAITAANTYRTAPDVLENAISEFRKWSAVAPELARSIQQANVIGCGFRLDTNGNALASLRVALDKELTDPLIAASNGAPSELPFGVYDGGGFVLNGAGRLPPSVLTTMTTAYLRRTAADLNESEEKTEFDEAILKRLQEAVQQAAAEVRSAVVLTQPGAEPQPIYTNSFIALRVASATAFVGHANEVMRLWNKANREAKGEMPLVFDVEEVKLGERTATQYSLDMATMGGVVVMPEIRQAMEKLFGPGGKMRFWVVPADDNTVLLANATSEQITTILKNLDRKLKIDWNRGELSECNALLPAESDWRVFVDPHRYFDWARREAAAVAGVPVIGGPLVRDFPASPPVGIAGGFREGELWLEAAALAPTIKSADMYLAKNRSRTSIRMRARVLAPQPNR